MKQKTRNPASSWAIAFMMLGMVAACSVAGEEPAPAPSPTQAALPAPIPNDGRDDRAAIQALIDAAGTKGGGTVSLPGGRFEISGPLYLRSNVILEGARSGTPTLITNEGRVDADEWYGTTLFAGNLTTASFEDNDGRGYPGMPARRVSDRRYTIEECDPARVARMRGQMIWFSTSEGRDLRRSFRNRNAVNRGPAAFRRDAYGEINRVDAVDGCSVTLASPSRIPENISVAIHFADGSLREPGGGRNPQAQPNRGLVGAGARYLSLASDASTALLVSGCYGCTFENLKIERTRRLAGLQGARNSRITGLQGNFSEKGLELSTYATDNLIERINGVYVDDGRFEARPAMRFGEYARRNRLRDIRLDLRRGGPSLGRIRFDESAYTEVENVRLLVNDGQRRRIVLVGEGAQTQAGPVSANSRMANVAACADDGEADCQPVGLDPR